MALADKITTLPDKPKPAERWTHRAMSFVGSIKGTLRQLNPYQFILVGMLIADLFKEGSIAWHILTGLVLVASVAHPHLNYMKGEIKEKK